MTEFHQIAPNFSASPQIRASDVARAAAEGFTIILCNRPDGEMIGQPAAAEIAQAATEHGLAFQHLPVKMPVIDPGHVATTAAALNEEGAKVLAYCASGTRSTIVWAMAQISSGAMSVDDAIRAARAGGYDIEGARPLLEQAG